MQPQSNKVSRSLEPQIRTENGLVTGFVAAPLSTPKGPRWPKAISSIAQSFPNFQHFIISSIFKLFIHIHSVQLIDLIVPIQAEVAVWIGFSFPA